MMILEHTIEHDNTCDRVLEIMHVVNNMAIADYDREIDLCGLNVWLSSTENMLSKKYNYFVTFFEKDQAVGVYYVTDGKSIEYIDVTEERKKSRKNCIASSVCYYVNSLIHSKDNERTTDDIITMIDENPIDVIGELLESLDVMSEHLNAVSDDAEHCVTMYSKLKNEIRGLLEE